MTIRRLTVMILGMTLAACEHTVPLREIARRREYYALVDTTLTTRGVLTSLGARIPFTHYSVRRIADGVDTMTIVVVDTTPVGRRITLRVRVHTGVMFGVDLGPVLVADETARSPQQRIPR